MILRSLIVPVLLLSIVFVGRTEAAKDPTISNECGVECFPCVSPSDPFCRQPGPPWPEGIPVPSSFCKKCALLSGGQATCTETSPDEVGNTVCGLVYDGNTVVSCTTSGSFCTSISVTP